MYHSWGSQNAWLRQIIARNFLYLHPDTGGAPRPADDDWVELDSHHGRITVPVQADRQRAAGHGLDLERHRQAQRRLGAVARTRRKAIKGFLLNHLISDILTPNADYANADPVTGQAAWFDLRVSIRKVGKQAFSSPQFAPLGESEPKVRVLRYGAKA